jgi:hypothetical protein
MFARFFPVISIWEIQEGRQESAKAVTERITSYMPDPQPRYTGSMENEG